MTVIINQIRKISNFKKFHFSLRLGLNTKPVDKPFAPAFGFCRKWLVLLRASVLEEMMARKVLLGAVRKNHKGNANTSICSQISLAQGVSLKTSEQDDHENSKGVHW